VCENPCWRVAKNQCKGSESYTCYPRDIGSDKCDGVLAEDGKWLRLTIKQIAFHLRLFILND